MPTEQAKLPPAGVQLGCSKCRYAKNGCGTCRAKAGVASIAATPASAKTGAKAAADGDDADDEDDDDANVYEVDKILDLRRNNKGVSEYLIKWKGWGAQHNSWEPRENIMDDALIGEFEAKLAKKTPKKSPKEAAVPALSLIHI